MGAEELGHFLCRRGGNDPARFVEKGLPTDDGVAVLEVTEVIEALRLLAAPELEADLSLRVLRTLREGLQFQHVFKICV